jgi:hypothetical protein
MTRRQRRKLYSVKPAAQLDRKPEQRSLSAAEPSVEATDLSERHSTGPVTPDGKAISSRNAVKHGLCARKLTGADLEELNAIRARLDHEWEPATETEKLLLQQMALSQWRLERALELEISALEPGALNAGIDPALLALALRYRTSAERSFYKALAELQRLRTSMREDAFRDARREREEETSALRRLEAQILGPVYIPPAQFVSQNTTAGSPDPQFVSQTAHIKAEPRASADEFLS